MGHSCCPRVPPNCTKDEGDEMNDKAAGRIESLFDRASRIAREQKAEANRRARLESSEALQAVGAELGALEQMLEQRGRVVQERTGLTGGIEAGPDRSWAVQFAGFSTVVHWNQRYSDSVRHAALVVQGFNRNHSFAGYSHGEPKPVSEHSYELDIVGDQWLWRELEARQRTERVLTTDQLADAILHELLDRWETPPEQREEYRALGAR